MSLCNYSDYVSIATFIFFSSSPLCPTQHPDCVRPSIWWLRWRRRLWGTLQESPPMTETDTDLLYSTYYATALHTWGGACITYHTFPYTRRDASSQQAWSGLHAAGCGLGCGPGGGEGCALPSVGHLKGGGRERARATCCVVAAASFVVVSSSSSGSVLLLASSHKAEKRRRRRRGGGGQCLFLLLLLLCNTVT